MQINNFQNFREDLFSRIENFQKFREDLISRIRAKFAKIYPIKVIIKEWKLSRLLNYLTNLTSKHHIIGTPTACMVLSFSYFLCLKSRYGEIVNINLVRDKKTGKSKGYGFICYEDQRSTILAVDNFNGIKV